jgi:hypothetical protein
LPWRVNLDDSLQNSNLIERAFPDYAPPRTLRELPVRAPKMRQQQDLWSFYVCGLNADGLRLQLWRLRSRLARLLPPSPPNKRLTLPLGIS